MQKYIGEKMKEIVVLGIETSCDETSVSVVINGRKVLSNIINSQIDIHTLYGGVVTEIASRCFGMVSPLPSFMSSLAFAIASYAVFDFGAVASIIAQLARGILASGRPSAFALSQSEYVICDACG